MLHRTRLLALAAATGLAAPPLMLDLRVAHAGPASSNACPGDNGGLVLPSGFCAAVFADGIGHARHLAVSTDGVVYANTWSGTYYQNDKPHAGGFLVAMKDTTGSGKADKIERFGLSADEGAHGGTGVALYGGGVYAEESDKIVRYDLPKGGLAPSGRAKVVVSGLPTSGDHPMHPFIIDKDGHIFVDLGSATNACQAKNRMPGSAARDNPCTELETRAGTWEYDAGKTDQAFSPKERFVTGLRNGEGFAFDKEGRLFATQHGRDQLFENWPALYKQPQGAELPAEELVHETKGADFGWPYCYDDQDQGKLVLAPEFGGDGGHKVGVCAQKTPPVAAFPGHWAPNDLAIYQASAFPDAYDGAAFIAFHGSWNRAPAPQGGYNVVVQPLKDGHAAGKWTIFADGFAGPDKNPGQATHRPTGLAIGPDGALYIADDIKGTIWRVTYHGDKSAALQSAPAVTSSGKVVDSEPPEGIHPDAGAPEQSAAKLTPPAGTTKEQLALGAQVFLGQKDGGTCAGCHGNNAKGTPIGPALITGHWLWGDGSLDAIQSTIQSGVAQPKAHPGAMPPMGGAPLSPEDVKAVAAYVFALNHQS